MLADPLSVPWWAQEDPAAMGQGAWNPPPLPMLDGPTYTSPEKQEDYWGGLGMEMPGPPFFTPTRLFPANGSDWTPMNPMMQEHGDMIWDYVSIPDGPGHVEEASKKWLPLVPPVPSNETEDALQEHRFMKTVDSVMDSPRTPRRSEGSEEVEAISPSPRRVDVDCDRNFSLPATPMQVRGWVPETPSPLTYRVRHQQHQHQHMHLLSASLAAGDGLPPSMQIPMFGEATALWPGN
jgi:hypothetical protein